MDEVERREWHTLTSTINFDVLRQRASALRGGTPCSIPSSNDEEIDEGLRGAWNSHLPLLFEDGRRWICRIRRQHVRAPNLDMQNILIAGEVEEHVGAHYRGHHCSNAVEGLREVDTNFGISGRTADCLQMLASMNT